MKKAIACIILMCLLTSCSTGKRITLPDAGDINRATVTNGETTVEIEDIAGLLQRMGEARDTGYVSVQDRPEADWLLQIDFSFRRGGVSTVFLYKEGGKVVLEQPYQGIFEVNKDALDYLWE